ncbi:MAG: septum site-determining protein Ssd, partial [Actinomycetes bacterium]
GQVSPSALARALPSCRGLPVLAWDRGAPAEVPDDAVRAVLEAARRSHDLVVADLPRRLDPAAQIVAAGSDLVLLVVPAEVRAAAAAARVASSVGLVTADLRIVVRGPAPSGLTGTDVAASLGLPFAGWLRPEPGLAAVLERGEAPAGTGRGPLADLCGQLLDGVLGGREVAA